MVVVLRVEDQKKQKKPERSQKETASEEVTRGYSMESPMSFGTRWNEGVGSDRSSQSRQARTSTINNGACDRIRIMRRNGPVNLGRLRAEVLGALRRRVCVRSASYGTHCIIQFSFLRRTVPYAVLLPRMPISIVCPLSVPARPSWQPPFLAEKKQTKLESPPRYHLHTHVQLCPVISP